MMSMPTVRVTANLPSRDFDATIAFYGRLGFSVSFGNAGWLSLRRGTLELEFFPHPELEASTSWFSACNRVADINALLGEWQALGLSDAPDTIPRLTGALERPDAPRMFVLIDNDGSLLRCLENGG